MQKTISIQGMNCQHCVNRVKNALNEINGVSDVVVDLKQAKAVVTLSADVSNDILKAAVEDVGYDVVDIN